MSPMVTAGALAISHRLAPRLAAARVCDGLLLSLLTLRCGQPPGGVIAREPSAAGRPWWPHAGAGV